MNLKEAYSLLCEDNEYATKESQEAFKKLIESYEYLYQECMNHKKSRLYHIKGEQKQEEALKDIKTFSKNYRVDIALINPSKKYH